MKLDATTLTPTIYQKIVEYGIEDRYAIELTHDILDIIIERIKI